MRFTADSGARIMTKRLNLKQRHRLIMEFSQWLNLNTLRTMGGVRVPQRTTTYHINFQLAILLETKTRPLEGRVFVSNSSVLRNRLWQIHSLGHCGGVSEIATIKGVVRLRTAGNCNYDVVGRLARADPVPIHGEAVFIGYNRSLFGEPV